MRLMPCPLPLFEDILPLGVRKGWQPENPIAPDKCKHNVLLLCSTRDNITRNPIGSKILAKAGKRVRSARSRRTSSEATLLKNLHLRIDPDLIDLIREAADLDQRPVSQWVRVTLKKAAEEQVRRHQEKGGSD